MTNFSVVVGDDKSKKKNTHVASRWFAVLVFALCICSFTVLPYNVIQTEADAGIQSTSMLGAMFELLKNPSVTFNMLPGFEIAGRTGDYYNLAIYLFTLFCIIALLIALFAILSKDIEPRSVRRSLFFLGSGELGYSFAFTAAVDQLKGRGYEITSSINEMFTSLPVTLEVLSLAMGVGCLVLSLCFIVFKKKQLEEDEEA